MAIVVAINAMPNALYGQVTTPTNTIGAADYIGSSNAFDAVFKTNNTTRMTLKQGTGNFGIGTTTPVHKLEVTGGDINIETATDAYRLAGARILWNYGNAKNLFVGTGTANTTHTGEGNTFVGNAVAPAFTTGDDNSFFGIGSGTALTAGNFNSFFGANSGASVTTGSENAFFGDHAGFSNTFATGNSCFGYEAGRANVIEAENTYIGNKSGRNNTGFANTMTGFETGLATSGADYNCFYGSRSGRANTTGQLNTFMGYNTGPVNTLGTLNVFIGAGAGSLNTEGNNNTFAGYLAGMSTTTGDDNTYIGYHAGRYNITGGSNTAVGREAGRNSTGNSNVFMGNTTAYATTSGGGNTMIGAEAGDLNTTGANNTFLGFRAGDGYATGSENVFVGYVSDANGNYSNAAGIGTGAIVTASNRMQFGNGAVTGCYNTSGLWTTSDGRFKFNVNENVSGLAFIKRLRPVTYQMNTAELDAFVRANMPQSVDSTGAEQSGYEPDFGPSMAMTHAGFIAQEVEQAAIESGFVSSIVSVPTHENDPYAVSYSQIVVPLVKAVQEQQETIENQNERLSQLEEALAQMQGLLEQCCTTGSEMRLDGSEEGLARTTTVELGSGDEAILYQNRPNPFTEGTVINYYLPKSVKAASMVFHDNAGQVIKEITLSDRGSASVTVQPNGLAAGVYTYSLTVDGKTVETKRMVKGN